MEANITQDEIVRIAYSAVGRLLRGTVPRADREDIAQEAAMRALKARATCKAERSPDEQRAYYAQAARSRAIDCLRSKRARQSHEALVPGEDWSHPTPGGAAWTPMDSSPHDYLEAAVVQAELTRTVEAARQIMSPCQRAVFDDRVGLAELPEEMRGLRAGTRGVHIRVAREKLAAVAEREGVQWLRPTLLAALCTR